MERYLDRQGIFLDILEYKLEDIEDLVDECRHLGDIECGVTLRSMDAGNSTLQLPVVATPSTCLPGLRIPDSSQSSNQFDGTTCLPTPSSHETPFGTPLKMKGPANSDVAGENETTIEEETGPQVARRLEYKQPQITHGSTERCSKVPSNLPSKFSLKNLVSGQRRGSGIGNAEIHEMQRQNLDDSFQSIDPTTSPASSFKGSPIGREWKHDKSKSL